MKKQEINKLLDELGITIDNADPCPWNMQEMLLALIIKELRDIKKLITNSGRSANK